MITQAMMYVGATLVLAPLPVDSVRNLATTRGRPPGRPYAGLASEPRSTSDAHWLSGSRQ
jgi:hypothetical protein